MKDSIILTREFLEMIDQLVAEKNADELKRVLADMHPADIAEMCDDMSIEDARYIYHLLEGEDAADVLIEMDEDARNELLEELPSETIAKKFVDFMDTDDAVDIIRDMDEDKQEEVLAHIEDIEQAGDIVDLLKYDEDTAGGIMGTEMVIVNENWSMPDCLREMRLQAEDRDEIYNVYVVDDEERLQGVFPLKKMITNPSVSKVKHVMDKDLISIHVDTPVEEVVQLIEKSNLVSVPVNWLSATTSWLRVFHKTWRATTACSSRLAPDFPGCLSVWWADWALRPFLDCSMVCSLRTRLWRSLFRLSVVLAVMSVLRLRLSWCKVWQTIRSTSATLVVRFLKSRSCRSSMQLSYRLRFSGITGGAMA